MFMAALFIIAKRNMVGNMLSEWKSDTKNQFCDRKKIDICYGFGRVKEDWEVSMCKRAPRPHSTVVCVCVCVCVCIYIYIYFFPPLPGPALYKLGYP